MKDNNLLKTLGPKGALLVTTLHERNQPIFTLGDAQRIAGVSSKTLRKFTANLVNRGVATRLRPGLFILVPFELGKEKEFLGNPFIVGRELASFHVKSKIPYYISHATAMQVHGMTTQPQLVVHVTSTRERPRQTILGTEFRFIYSRQRNMFGATPTLVDQHEKVMVSDLEKTVIDCLGRPDYSGGIAEVAKGMWMRRRDLNPKKLFDYSTRLGIGAVVRRLGYLMEIYEMAPVKQMERLRKKLSQTYALLDPGLPREGKYLAKWRLRLNVSEEELKAIVRT